MAIVRLLERFFRILLVFGFAAAILTARSTEAAYHRIPEPGPPTIDREVSEAPSAKAAADFMAPSAAVEWTYHKTSDNLHPDGNEQQMLWLMNRARSDPAQEGAWLATESDPDIAAARTYWGVNLTVLQNEFAAIPAKPPAAFDVRLYNAAKAHSNYLISIDGQTHDGQIARIAGRCSAQMVGFALASLASHREHKDFEEVPWQRIINAKGKISPHGFGMGGFIQRQKLEEEGIEFDNEGVIDLEKFGWDGVLITQVRSRMNLI